MYPTLSTATTLQLARFHQADVRAGSPRRPRRPLWRRSRSPETSPTPPRKLRLPAIPTFHRPSAPA